MVDAEDIAGSVLVVALVIVLLSQVVSVGVSLSGGERTTTADGLGPSGGSVSLTGDNVSVVDVHQSLNDSAQLDGSAGITGDLGDDVADNRTVSTWAQVDNTTGVRQIVSVDSRTILVYNGSTSEWACWSYDDASSDTHRVAVSASASANWTNLQCERASGTLTLRVNDTTTASVATDSANATTQTLQTEPLDGRIDETRTFNGTLTSSEQSSLYANATAPLESADRQSRVMYDSYGALDTVPVYIAGGSLDGTAATKVAGLDGQGAIEGTDWSLSSDVLSLLAGGSLEGAPVVFVTWLSGSGGVGGVLGSIVGLLRGVLVLLVLLPLAAAGKRLLDSGGF